MVSSGKAILCFRAASRCRSLLRDGRGHGTTRLPYGKAPLTAHGLVNQNADPTRETISGPGDRRYQAPISQSLGYLALHSTIGSATEQLQILAARPVNPAAGRSAFSAPSQGQWLVPSGRGSVRPIRGSALLLHPPCRSPEQSAPREKVGFVPVAALRYNCAAARVHAMPKADLAMDSVPLVTMVERWRQGNAPHLVVFASSCRIPARPSRGAPS